MYITMLKYLNIYVCTSYVYISKCICMYVGKLKIYFFPTCFPEALYLKRWYHMCIDTHTHVRGLCGPVICETALCMLLLLNLSRVVLDARYIIFDLWPPVYLYITTWVSVWHYILNIHTYLNIHNFRINIQRFYQRLYLLLYLMWKYIITVFISSFRILKDKSP